MNADSDRRGVAGLLFPGLPFHLALTRPAGHGLALPILFTYALPKSPACLCVKGDHARVWLSADHHEQSFAFKNRRTAHAEKCRWHVPINARIPLPKQLARLQVQKNKFALRAEGVTAVLRKQGCAARPVVVAVRIDEVARICVAPKRLACGGVESFDD